MTQKEELRENFNKIFTDPYKPLRAISSNYIDAIFDFFYSEIEAREKFKTYVHARLDKAGVPENPDPENNAKHGCRIEGRLNFLEAKISHLESTLEAADEVIKAMEIPRPKMTDSYAIFSEALEKYNQLKTKSQS